MDSVELSHSRRVSSELRISTPASLSLSKPASPTQFDSSAFDTNFDHLSVDVTTPAEFTSTPNMVSVKPTSSITSSPESSAVASLPSHRRRSSAGDVSAVLLQAANTPTSSSHHGTPLSGKPVNYSHHRPSHSISQSKQPSARSSPVVPASTSQRNSPKTLGKRIAVATEAGKSNQSTPPQHQRPKSPSSGRSIHSGQNTPEPLSARSHTHSRNNSVAIVSHSPTLAAITKVKSHKTDKDVHLHHPPTLSSRRPSIGSGNNVVAPHSTPTGGSSSSTPAASTSKKGHARTDSRIPPHTSPTVAHRGHTPSLMQYPSPTQSSIQAKQSSSLKKAVQAVGAVSKFGRSTPATPRSRPETPAIATPLATPQTPYDPTQYTLLLTPQLERDLDARSLRKGGKSMKRSASFGTLNKRVAATWAVKQTQDRIKAEMNFQVTQLQQEKAKLQHDLEQAKLVISDLRYAAYRKEMATEKVVGDLKEEVQVAEASLTDMKMKYLEQRRSVYSYRFLLVRNAILSFVHRYKLKRRMRHLYTDMRELVMMIEKEKREAAITNDIGLMLPQAETKEYLLSSETLWADHSHSLFFISTERLMLNLKDGLETVRMAMSNSLHISAALRNTADKMFERNTAVMTDALQLREDLSSLNNGRDHLWKEPMLLPRVLDRMKHEEEMKEKRKEKQAAQDKKDAALRAVLAPRSPTSSIKSYTSSTSRPSSARIARTRENAMAAAYAHSTTVSPTRQSGNDVDPSPSLQHSASVHLPLPRSTSSRRNLLHSSTSRASIIAAAVAASAAADQEAKVAGAGPSKEEMNDPHRATPRSPASAPRSSVQKIQLSSTGFAYRHYRSELKSSKQKKEERDRKIMAEVIAKAEEEEARQQQLLMEEQKRQEEEEKKILAARKAARKPKPPPTAFHANYANFYLRRHPDIDDDMMLGWRDDSDEEEPYCNKRVLHTITALEPEKIITEFAEPPKPRRRGKVMFQYAVAQVIRQQRQKFASFKAAMNNYKKMDVDNFEIDMHELDDWQPEELYN